MGQKLLVESTGSRLENSENNGSGELHHFLHQYNQQSPSPNQSLQGNIPMPLSPQSLRHDGSSGIGIKREPEDLSSSRGGQQSNKRHKQAQPDSPTPPGMYHHHQHQLQVTFITTFKLTILFMPPILLIAFFQSISRIPKTPILKTEPDVLYFFTSYL